nr:hypothetical protein BaRGS_028162 [Batillaria attramentaria]
MEAVLARLDEEEGEITRQRSAMDHDIQTRYAAGLRHMADARDQCLSSLRDAAQAAQDKLEDVDVDYKELLTNANLRHDVTAIQADFARLQQKVQAESETLKQEMAALQADNAKVHQELTTMGAENVRLLKDVRSQQADAARLNTDTADLKQDVAYLKAENKKNGTDFDTLKKDVGSLTQDLAALLDKASGDATPATDKAEEKTATYSLICPTCRSVTPVPPGGVQHFQSNFYVEDEAYTNMEPAPGAKATEQNTVDDGDLQDKVKTQFKVMEAVLARLDEEEGEIIRQRRAMDHDIQTRYAAGLRYLADARDQCLISLRDAAQAAQDKLEVERTLAKMTHSALSPLMDPEQTSSNPSSPDTAQASLLNDATLRHFQQISQKKLEPKSYFSYCPSDSVTPSLTDSLGRFMGTVISDRTVRANDNFSKSSGSVDAEYMELRSPSANTGHDVTSVQPDIEKLEIKFQAEIDTLKQAMAGLQAKLSENVRLSQVARSQETDSATLTTDKADVSELEAEDEDDDPDFETIHHNIDLVKVSTEAGPFQEGA